jgi:hypothetical protein
MKTPDSERSQKVSGAVAVIRELSRFIRDLTPGGRFVFSIVAIGLVIFLLSQQGVAAVVVKAIVASFLGWFG